MKKSNENQIVITVPRLRASPRHGGARFFEFFSHFNHRHRKPRWGAAAVIATVNDDPSFIISDYYDYHGKSCHSPFFRKVMRVTTSLPQRGRQTKGRIPLTPYLYPVSGENFSSYFS
jgi:hypothetical protein